MHALTGYSWYIKKYMQDLIFYLPFVDVTVTEGWVVLGGIVDIFVTQLAFLE